MVSCKTCKYSVNKKHRFIVCKYYDKVFDLKHYNACARYKPQKKQKN